MTDEPRVLLEDFEIYEPIEEVDAWTDFKPLEMVTSVDDNEQLEELEKNRLDKEAIIKYYSK